MHLLVLGAFRLKNTLGIDLPMSVVSMHLLVLGAFRRYS